MGIMRKLIRERNRIRGKNNDGNNMKMNKHWMKIRYRIGERKQGKKRQRTRRGQIRNVRE